MKRMLTAVVSTFWLAWSCSGRDVDIGNGTGNVKGTDNPGTTAATGSTTGSDPGTTGGVGTGVTTGSATAATGTGTSGTTGTGTTSGVTTGSATAGSGGASGTGTGGGTGGGSAGSSGTSTPATAIVIRYGDIPVSDPGGGGTSATTGGTTIDPDTPYFIVGSAGPTCRDPKTSFDCGYWRVAVGIPRALFQPGVLRLDDPRLISFESVRGPDRGGGDCYGGGGSFMDGTLEIVDIGATVHVRLSNTFKLDFDADGSYAALNCQ